VRFVIVTTNKGKAEEFSSIFSKYGLRFRVEHMRTPEIQSENLEEIAGHSVMYAYKTLREPVMVEDAGLFIDALNGFPGPYSSYVYRTLGVSGILRLMDGVVDREADFISVVAFYSPFTGLRIFGGKTEGLIAEEPKGVSGFGFDPIFIPREGDGRTYAEMSVEEKSRVSHRGKAARKFAEWVKTLRDEELPPPYR